MEYIYAVLLLHSAGKEINEENVKKVIEAAGLNPDEAKIKSIVSSVKQINIDEVLKSALAVPVAPTPVPAAETKPEKVEEKEEEEKEEEEKREEEVFEGLSSLFG